MPAEWTISSWPACSYHVFLSHCAEDRATLVAPVFQSLRKQGLIPWLDRHHYPAGRDSFENLAEQLLRCRHVAYFITPKMLKQGRGWPSVERAFAATIQRQLRLPDEIIHFELPLLFVPPDDPVLQRSCWRSLLDKAIRFSPTASSANRPREQTRWAAREIARFIRREEQWGAEIAQQMDQDRRFAKHFLHDENLRLRVRAAAPPRLPQNESV